MHHVRMSDQLFKKLTKVMTYESDLSPDQRLNLVKLVNQYMKGTHGDVLNFMSSPQGAHLMIGCLMFVMELGEECRQSPDRN